MKALRLLAAASLLVVASAQADAQSIANRVAAVRDGKVRMTFAARPDICGFPNGIGTSRTERTTWSKDRSEDVEYDVDCSEGPARIVATMSGGVITRIDAYVGGRWRAGSRATDIGNVGTKDATDWLMRVASGESSKVSGSALFAVTLADSVDVANALYGFARNTSNPRQARETAVFWLGQSRGESTSDSTQLLRRLYTQVESDDLRDKVIFSLSQQRGVNDEWLLELVGNPRESLEMRKKALFWAGQSGAPMSRLSQIYSQTSERAMKDQIIFVFAQRRESAAVDKLIDIAKNDPDREARRKAMFWLGQSKDPRVVAMLTEIINR